MKQSFAYVLAAATWWFLFTPAAQALPDGFNDVGIAYVSSPIDILFFPPPGPGLPSPLMVVNKNGEVWLIEDPDNESEPMLLGDFDAGGRLCTDGSRGLMSAVPHPEFYSNRWLYIFYNEKGERNCQDGHSTVSRVRLNDDYTVNLATEEILFITTATQK